MKICENFSPTEWLSCSWPVLSRRQLPSRRYTSRKDSKVRTCSANEDITDDFMPVDQRLPVVLVDVFDRISYRIVLELASNR